MIYKDCDNKQPVVAILQRMLALAGPDKSTLIERELRTLRAGIMGERESAYLIDFHLKDATRTGVVHDLRLDLGADGVAQIDHLLIHRTRRFSLLETKHFSRGLKITDEGEFLRWNSFRKNYDRVPSPLEQNERHVLVLRRALESLGLGDCPIDAWVLVAPNARIERPRKFDTAQVQRVDLFIEKLNKSLDGAPALGALGGLHTGLHDSVGDIAHKLIALHRPSTTDYMARFGLAREPKPAGVTTLSPVAPAAATAVALAAGGQEEAQAGQTAAPAGDVPTEPAAPAAAPPAAAAACSACGGRALSIQLGRFGYYFKCGACEATTVIDLGCGQAGHKERLRREGLQFYRECSGCGTSSLYYTNGQ